MSSLLFNTKKKEEKPPILYDVRINGNDDGVILLKGGVREAPSVLFSGTIVLSLAEPTTVKSVIVRIFGKYIVNVEIPDLNDPNFPIKYVKQEKVFFERKLDDIPFENYLHLNNNNSYLHSNGLPNLNFVGNRTRSMSSSFITSNNTGTNGEKKKKNHIIHKIPRGNYEFPFSTILPGTICESIQGMPNAEIKYYLQAVIERGKHSDLIINKDFNIIRTPNIDAIELSETVSVQNNWPDKVDYLISVPTKAIAIGTATHINISLVPLSKQLKLGSIRMALFEQYQYTSIKGSPISGERKILKTKIKDPLGHVEIIKKSKETGNDFFLFQNKWEISSTIKIPANLSKCTQDCLIKKYCKVRHKLKFTISLINADGHISQLRASLPIILYISPFIPISIPSKEQRDEMYTTTNNINNKSDEQKKKKSKNNNINNDELLFTSAGSSLELQSLGLGLTTDLSNNKNNNNNSNIDLPPTLNENITELMIPPNYEDSAYDRLCSEGSIPNSMPATPIFSNAPIIDDLLVVNDDDNDSIMTDLPPDISLIGSNNPYQTDLSSQDIRPAPPHRSISIPNTPSDRISSRKERSSSDALHLHGSPFSRSSSGLTIHHNPFTGSPQFNKKKWVIKELSRVPSYDMATKGIASNDDLPPLYKNSKKTDKKRSASVTESSNVRRSSSFLQMSASNKHKLPISKSSNNSTISLNNTSRNSMIILPTKNSNKITSPSPFSTPESKPRSSNSNNATTSKRLSLNMTPTSTNQKSSSESSTRSSSRANSATNVRALNTGNSTKSKDSTTERPILKNFTSIEPPKVKAQEATHSSSNDSFADAHSTSNIFGIA